MADRSKYTDPLPESQAIDYGAFLDVDAYVVDRVFPLLSLTDIILYKLIIQTYGHSGGTDKHQDIDELARRFGFNEGTFVESAQHLNARGLIDFIIRGPNDCVMFTWDAQPYEKVYKDTHAEYSEGR